MVSQDQDIQKGKRASFFQSMCGLYCCGVSKLSHMGDCFLIGLSARFVFASVLFLYFFNSALTKIGEGVFGFLSIESSAYFQILPSVVEAYGFNPSAVPFFPYGIIVYAGTYAEFILPVFIVLGLFTRLAALGMIGFIFVQSFVDVQFHKADAQTIGAFFDRVQDSAILDQRFLWIFVLFILVVKGAGCLSLDWLLTRKSSK